MLRSSSSAGLTCLSQWLRQCHQYRLCLEMEVGCALRRALTTKLVTSRPRRTLLRRRRFSITMLWVLWLGMIPSSWHGIAALEEQQALCRVLHFVRDDPTLQERVKQPPET